MEQAVPDAAALATWGLCDPRAGMAHCARLAASLGEPGWRDLQRVLARVLHKAADPDLALITLTRFLSPEDRQARLEALLDGRGRGLEQALALFSVSRSFGDLLVSHPDSLHLLRPGPRRSPPLADLVNGLLSDARNATDATAQARVFRRFRLRQLLRVGVNDILRDRSLEDVIRDISRVADASIQAAYQLAFEKCSARLGTPITASGKPARAAVFALGKLGGEELNYSSDLDLLVLHDEEGSTQGSRREIDCSEFFSRVTTEMVQLLASPSDAGLGYRIDLRLRPEGHGGPVTRTIDSALAYYDRLGRTWERQALIKLRPVAGDADLGAAFLRGVQPFVYRKYLSFSEINEIKVLKRRIERRAASVGNESSDLKTGPGGIRDIEFVIQFLQLLHGGDEPGLRQRSTLVALPALERAGCLTDQEYRVLDDAYRFLRRAEHRLQLLFDLQTHRLPDDADGRERLARRMGFEPAIDRSATEAFLGELEARSRPTRLILEHLLHQSITDPDELAEPETDLILDPSVEPETVHEVLSRHGFTNTARAHASLLALATEPVPFLSTRRCRLFLASIAPALLGALKKAPDPDQALANLERVTASLGARTELWELFRVHPPSLRLVVDLCARSQFLTDLLISNPGMADELLDSLVLDRPPERMELETELAGLLRGAEDPQPILKSFLDKELLRVGVRDLLNRDDVHRTGEALTDLAEVTLGGIAHVAQATQLARSGPLYLMGEQNNEKICRWVLLGLGRLGSREMSYHSDLDIILIYEGPARPAWDRDGSGQADSHQHFTELAQSMIRRANPPANFGRLYQVDMRLRPDGRSGALVASLPEFLRHHAANTIDRLWEKLALVRARPIAGDLVFGMEVMAALDSQRKSQPWLEEGTQEVLAMRLRLEASRPLGDLKRGPGGLTDIEFLAQTMQLKHANRLIGPIEPGTRKALILLAASDLLPRAVTDELGHAHEFLSRCLARLRLAHNRQIDELPASDQESIRLADEIRKRVRQMFTAWIDA